MSRSSSPVTRWGPLPPDGLLIVLTARRGSAYYDPRDGHFYRYHSQFSAYVCYNKHIRVHCRDVCEVGYVEPCFVRFGGDHLHPPPTRAEVECLYLHWRATLHFIQSPFLEGASSAVRRVVVDHPRDWALDVTSPDVFVRSWKSYFSSLERDSRARSPSFVRLVRETRLVPCATFLDALLQERGHYCPLPPLRPVGEYFYLFFILVLGKKVWFGALDSFFYL